MAGKPKQGIDFAGWSVNIFDGDTKIDKLLEAQKAFVKCVVLSVKDEKVAANPKLHSLFLSLWGKSD